MNVRYAIVAFTCAFPLHVLAASGRDTVQGLVPGAQDALQELSVLNNKDSSLEDVSAGGENAMAALLRSRSERRDSVVEIGENANGLGKPEALVEMPVFAPSGKGRDALEPPSPQKGGGPAKGGRGQGFWRGALRVGKIVLGAALVPVAVIGSTFAGPAITIGGLSPGIQAIGAVVWLLSLAAIPASFWLLNSN